MPDFSYIARNAQGQRIAGTIAAASPREASDLLARQQLFPLEVAARKQPFRLTWRRGVGGQVLAVFYSQLASLLRGGVPMLRSLALLREQSSHRVLKTVLEDVHSRVEDGTPLAETMARHQYVFGEMAVSMVRAGGEGGFLEEALDRVAQFTEQYEDLKSRTTGALAYPMFLGAVGFLVVTGLVVFFVPKFAELFDTLRTQGQLPAATEWLLWTSTSLRSWGWILLIVFAIAMVAFRQRLATDRGRKTWDGIKLRLPLVGPIFRSLAVARFCRVLGTLLKNGVPILKSLEISREAAGNRVLSAAIEAASENITAGQSLAKPLAESGHFQATVVEMISVAEEANTLEQVLVEIADTLERRTARQLDLAVRLLEPIMLLLLAMIVLFVVIALLMPVIKMSGTI